MVELRYGIESEPPIPLAIIFGIQHFLTAFGAIIGIPILLAPAMCVLDTPYGQVVKTKLMGTIFVTSGSCTLLQAFFGVRLPIVQGGTFSFLAATFSILATAPNKCPNYATATISNETLAMNQFGINITGSDMQFIVDNDGELVSEEALWQRRMMHLQGSILVAGLIEAAIGFSGLVGLLTKIVGPISVTCFISLVGLSLFDAGAFYAGTYWPISLFTICLLILFSHVVQNIKIPCCFYTPEKKLHKTKIPLFKALPVLLAIVISWALFAILTAADAKIPAAARTDYRIDALTNAPWFYFPYPFQWGTGLKFTLAGCVGMFAGSIASIFESMGDYYACAKISKIPPPPAHALNRGIMIEGFGCVLAAMMGTGNGTTSYSEDIGVVQITKIASRRVIIAAGLVMVFLGIFTKFMAVFVSIPSPVIGGLFCVMFGMIVAIGLSNLQYVDLNSSRNLLILGHSIFMGLALKHWINNDANKASIATGSSEADQLIQVLLSTSMLTGGVISIILDLLIPGTPEERGIVAWNQGETENAAHASYEVPLGVCVKNAFCKKLMICPGDDEIVVVGNSGGLNLGFSK